MDGFLTTKPIHDFMTFDENTDDIFTLKSRTYVGRPEKEDKFKEKPYTDTYNTPVLLKLTNRSIEPIKQVDKEYDIKTTDVKPAIADNL